jgi:hypothetical protein
MRVYQLYHIWADELPFSYHTSLVAAKKERTRIGRAEGFKNEAFDIKKIEFTPTKKGILRLLNIHATD